MYNGIGLQTARGSGTNGYIQSNKFFIKHKQSVVSHPPPSASLSDHGSKKANKEILEHDRKRRIELRLIVLEETLADQGYTQSEIAEKLQEARAALEAAPLDNPPDKRISDTQTHQIAARKEKQLETFRAALGIKHGDESPKHDTEEQKHQDKTRDLETEEIGGEKDREEKEVVKLTDGKQDHGEGERSSSKKGRATEEHRSKDALNEKKDREKKVDEVEHKKIDESRRIDKDTRKGRHKYVSASDSSGEDAKNDQMKPSRNTRDPDSRYDTDIRRSKNRSKVSEKKKIPSYHETDKDSDSSSESGREKTRKSRKVEVQTRKSRKVEEQRRYDSASETDGDDYRKKSHVKERPSKGRRHDRDESDSDRDFGREDTRKSSKYIKKQRGYDSDSETDKDAKKKKAHVKELPSKRRHDSDSDSGMEDTRKSSKFVKKQRRYDSDSETDGEDRRKKAHVNERSSRKRYDSCDSDSAGDDSESGKRRMGKHYNDKKNTSNSETVREKKSTENKKTLVKSRQYDSEDSSSSDDDSESYSSDSVSDSDSSYSRGSSGYRKVDAKTVKRLKSVVEKDLSSGISKKDDLDDRRTNQISYDNRKSDHSSPLKQSDKNHVEIRKDRKEVGDYENQDTWRKRTKDDRHDDLSVLEPRSSDLGKSEKMKESLEAKKDRENKDRRTHHERREDHRRDDHRYHGSSQKHYYEDEYEQRHKSRDDWSHSDSRRRKLESSRQYARSDRYERDSREDSKIHKRR